MNDGALLTAADLDARVAAFESAWAKDDSTDLGSFLPSSDDPDYLTVLVELVRIDLEMRYGRGESARVEQYRAGFPALFTDRHRLADVAFEEYRLRVAAGEHPTAHEYGTRFGVDTTGWPVHSSLPSTALSDSLLTDSSPVQYPLPGELVLDFRVVRELGRGSFGRVYLAEQTDLAGRRVAVKLTTRFGRAEPETLARLQHANIVPIYSTHRAGGFQALVMPYLGDTTLGDVLKALRGRETWPASGRELVTTLINWHSKTVADIATKPGPDLPRPGVSIEGLARFTYPDAVLWIGARLAEALTHAHERGIKHLDVKPANVLLTDDGQPMLLDFNLSADAAQSGDKKTGGTPGYMAPEQLLALSGKPSTVDSRADVFGLGVVLFELLTGRHPYPIMGSSDDPIRDLLAARELPPPSLVSFNPAVTPSTEAIVRRCLEPDPASRYPTAAALAEDLKRQLENQPLLHTREPSPRERFQKWRKRHPRLTSSGTVAAVAVGVIGAVSAAAFFWFQRVERLNNEAIAASRFIRYQLDVDQGTAEYVYAVWGGTDRKNQTEAVRRINELLLHYDRDSDAELGGRLSADFLPDFQRGELDRIRANLLALSEMGRFTLARSKADSPTAADWTKRLQANDLVIAAFRKGQVGGVDRVPRAVWRNRAKILEQLGRPDEAGQAGRNADDSSDTAQDYYLLGLSLLNEGQFDAAREMLTKTTKADAQYYLAWLARGIATYSAGRVDEAEWCAQVCVSLRPDDAVGYYHRGLARLRRKQYADSVNDFTFVIERRPDWALPYLGRAQALLTLDRTREALPDLDRAVRSSPDTPRVFFRRAEVRERLGDKLGAEADRKSGLILEPTDDGEWVERGLVRAATGDPTGALEDFDSALRWNPRSFEALQNKAYVLDEKLHRPADAINVLDRTLDLYPESLLARAGRAVLLARRGDRPAAHDDAERCLLTAGPDIRYQLAGVYALTSKTHPGDAKIALRLVADSLRQGYGFEFVEDKALDPDLEPIRGMPEFRSVVDSVKAARSGKN